MGEFTGKSNVKPYDLSQIGKVDEEIGADLEFLATYKDATGAMEKLMKEVAQAAVKMQAKYDDPDDILKGIAKEQAKLIAKSKLDNKMKTFATRFFKEMMDG